ncbi:hypothetical protein SPSIL_002560 [Sporomusa silvacetica DSM 10669]|uniref:CDI immunity protein domain-containing protein n=1 Tax=Sporomusa silvacetica DSM 10669 TaxID=1123289 RepID=A0ABZ3IEW5_9FIRM|nr:hypothetical protein [Sporomusa silvacetica]OZC17842.1 hypothetical protein SPSIL_29820 [Sporomusa silvacetica DSM 10669]
MKRDFRIYQTDDLDKRYFPITAFFNAIPDRDYLETIERMSMGFGTAYNEVNCQFPGDLDPWENTFDGIMFSVFDEEVIADYPTTYRFLKEASKSYSEDNPQDFDKINLLIKRFAEKFGITDTSDALPG